MDMIEKVKSHKWVKGDGRRMNKSKYKLVFLLIVTFFILLSFILQSFYRSPYTLLFVALIPGITALLPFISEYIESSIEERKKKRFVENNYNELKSYLQQFIQFPLHNPTIIEEYQSEKEIYERFIKSNFEDINNIAIQSIILCFYCDKWEKSKSPQVYGEMQKYSNSIGLSFAKLTDDVKVFLNLHSTFQSNKKFNSLTDIIQDKKDDSEYSVILNNFADKYVKDLSFFEIKDKLNQSENLRYTLVKIIKEGKLSNWGLSNDTLKQLEKDLKKDIDYSKTFLVIGNNLNTRIKDYLKIQPGFIGWAPNTRNIPYRGKFSGFIVKPKDKYDAAKKFLDKLKDLAKEKEEKEERIIFVIPLDFLNYERYVFPNNQSFKSTNLKECYEAISWFRTGYEFSDTDLWNVISSSDITPNQLLAVIPFNIFCGGILPCEQDFMIRNYSHIKEKCAISDLIDWKNVDPNVIVDYLLEKDSPDYNSTEKKRVLGVESKSDLNECLRKRILILCEQIVQNSTEFSDSLSLKIDH